MTLKLYPFKNRDYSANSYHQRLTFWSKFSDNTFNTGTIRVEIIKCYQLIIIV